MSTTARFLPLAVCLLLLTACTEIATPTPLVSGAALRQEAPTAPPDFAATLAVADAQARYAAETTATAVAVAQQTQAAGETATWAVETAQWSAVNAAATQSALTVTQQFVLGLQATGTYAAGAATQTATAAIPAGTATAAYQQARDAEQTRNNTVWMLITVALVVFLAVMFGLAGRAYVASLGVKREMEAKATYEISQAEAYAKRMRATREATHERRLGNLVLIMIGDSVVAERWLIEDPRKLLTPDGTPAPQNDYDDKPWMTAAQIEMVNFVQSAIEHAKFAGRSNYIPTDSDMGYSGSEWGRLVRVLTGLGVVGTVIGRPKRGSYGTSLVPQKAFDLSNLKDKLERGEIIIPPPPAVIIPPTSAPK